MTTISTFRCNLCGEGVTKDTGIGVKGDDSNNNIIKASLLHSVPDHVCFSCVKELHDIWRERVKDDPR